MIDFLFMQNLFLTLLFFVFIIFYAFIGKENDDDDKKD